MKVYSPDFAQGRDLPLALDPNQSFFTKVSASGKTIAVSRIVQKEHNVFISHLDVLDATTLKVRHSWNQLPPLYSNFSLSDTRIAIGHGSIIAVTEFESEWRTILDNSKSRCPAGAPTMVSDELVVLRNCKDILLLTATGVSHSLGSLNDDNSDRAATTQCEPYDGRISDKTAVASEVRFVALSLPAVRIKKHLLSEPSVCLTGLQVAVYDLALQKRVSTVNVDPLPKNDYDFALSPDGSNLAILNDRKVSVYLVSGQSVAHTDTVDSKDGTLHQQVPVPASKPKR